MLEALLSQEILGLTIIGEARSEPIEGQVAVASVVRNRLEIRKWGNTYNKVCLAPKQFSCWNKRDPNYKILMKLAEQIISKEPFKDISLRQCMLVADGIVHLEIKDNTYGRDHYMTTKLFNSQKRPSWAKIPLADPIIIGNHSFFSV